MVYLKTAFLFIAVWFTIVNIGRIAVKNNLPAVNLFFQAIGIAGFITLQWII